MSYFIVVTLCKNSQIKYEYSSSLLQAAHFCRSKRAAGTSISIFKSTSICLLVVFLGICVILSDRLRMHRILLLLVNAMFTQKCFEKGHRVFHRELSRSMGLKVVVVFVVLVVVLLLLGHIPKT